MRIIAGSARGRRLQAPHGRATRPTLDRVKEGMFSAVQPLLPGARVLDLFAGSGQLGLEALSRGAAHCTFVEQNAAAARLVAQNIESTGFGTASRLVKTTAQAFLAATAPAGYDLVLLDPPFGSDFLPGQLGTVAPACAPGAVVLCESAAADFPPRAGALQLAKSYRYGTVWVHRYRCRAETDG